MTILAETVNWVAVGFGALLAFLVGWIWYSPRMFGHRWADDLNVDMGGKFPVMPMLLQVVGLLLLSWFVGVMAAGDALAPLFLAFLAFLALFYSAERLAGHTKAVGLINAGYWVMSLFVMMLVQAIL